MLRCAAQGRELTYIDDSDPARVALEEK